jgi:DNA-binding PadR family transcriptional regulator
MLVGVMAPGRLSNTSAAVLGMVAAGARSGYEISRAVQRSVRFFWALGPPQIYAELKRLEEAGLIAGRDEARGERPRRLYEATADGRAELRRWVSESRPAEALEIRDPEMLRLFFADAVTPERAAERVAVIRARSEAMLELFDREIEPAAARASAAGQRFPEHVARFGRDLHEFIAGWCERLERELAAEGAAR